MQKNLALAVIIVFLYHTFNLTTVEGLLFDWLVYVFE